MRMQKRKFRIGQLAKRLSVERFVIRFWEKEFSLRSTRSDGGQRFYDEDDLNTFSLIKTLLYEKGFTIAGAKKQIFKQVALAPDRILASSKTTIEKSSEKDSAPPLQTNEKLNDKASNLKKHLLKIRELL